MNSATFFTEIRKSNFTLISMYIKSALEFKCGLTEMLEHLHYHFVNAERRSHSNRLQAIWIKFEHPYIQRRSIQDRILQYILGTKYFRNAFWALLEKAAYITLKFYRKILGILTEISEDAREHAFPNKAIYVCKRLRVQVREFGIYYPCTLLVLLHETFNNFS